MHGSRESERGFPPASGSFRSPGSCHLVVPSVGVPGAWPARCPACTHQCRLAAFFSEQKEILKVSVSPLPWKSGRRNQKVCGKESLSPRLGPCTVLGGSEPPPPQPRPRSVDVSPSPPGLLPASPTGRGSSQGRRLASPAPWRPSLRAALSFMSWRVLS